MLMSSIEHTQKDQKSPHEAGYCEEVGLLPVLFAGSPVAKKSIQSFSVNVRVRFCKRWLGGSAMKKPARGGLIDSCAARVCYFELACC